MSLLLKADESPARKAAAAIAVGMAAWSTPVYDDGSRPWLGPPPHSRRIKNKRRRLQRGKR